MRYLPAGTITMLFTDIEGSTRLLQRLGERYANVLLECQRLLRAAFQQWHGYEVDTQGDAFFVVFPRAADAVSAAVDIQRALHDFQWPEGASVRVRIGIHTGEPQPLAEGYVGLDVHVAARIMSAGHGGQVLLSQATQALVKHDLPANVSLRNLGEHYLKDIQGPLRLFQLAIPDLPADFPPLKTSQRFYHMPTQLTSFLGREREKAAISDLLRHTDARLVTLTGPGGVGKTRLAIQVATHLRERFPDGAIFVDLAQVGDTDGVMTAIAQALSVREDMQRSLFTLIQATLQEQHLLLLLDNFEQVASAALGVANLLAACPLLKMLVTSRVALHLQAEHTFDVPPLALPDLPSLPDLSTLSQYPAIQLFVQRASAVLPDFQLTASNAPSIASICTRLDGIPLAIELAAAYIRHFSPQTLLARLERSLSVLTGGARDLPSRQQTLRCAIAWSYELLHPTEQQVFRRLAICVNGCDLAAAEYIGKAAGGLPGSVFAALEALVDQNMLRQQESGNGYVRFWFLQTLREYGLECLEAAGEMETTRSAHAAYYLSWAEQSASYMIGADQADWMDRLEQEYENLRTALDWLLENAQPGNAQAEQAVRLCIALGNFWETGGNSSEALAYLERALAISEGLSPAISAKAYYQASMFSLTLDDYKKSESYLRECQALFRQTGDKAGMAQILRLQGILARTRHSYKVARRLLEEALAIYKDSDDHRSVASTRETLAELFIAQGNYDQARSLLTENLALFNTLHEHYYTAYPLYHLACVSFLTGDLAQAHTQAWESRALFKQVRNKRLVAYVHSLLGHILLMQGEHGRAEELLEESVETFRGLQDRYGLAEALLALGRLAGLQGDLTRGRSRYKESWSLLQESGIQELSALCLEGLGEIIAAQLPEQAAQLWAHAALIRARLVTPMPPIYRPAYERAVAKARLHLGETAFKTAWAEGPNVTVEEVIRKIFYDHSA